ncbi:hypothetical protein WOLCODRAFT_151861 [Wolfiporia cocos MD-104 SS10]|uniref:Uncharacterized protein n=1 Tax=Wolfiporia cocos (strain MD-104) TaxID=742152 RepID=A0A2H3JYJ4_WOLCO|nr:hypothetical protein WOLCODRAFT_151861 [Wolfiporia cocos MD-104 SS10]
MDVASSPQSSAPVGGLTPRPARQSRTPPALPTAPLDWTTPSCTLPRVPTRKGGPTRGGSPLRPRPSSGQRRKHLGSKRNGAHRPPWNKTRQLPSRVFTQRARRHRPPQQPGPPALLRANNQAPPPISRPKGKPRPRTYRARGSLCVATTAAHALGNPPGVAGHPSPNAHPAGPLRQRQTVAHQRKANTARATALVYQTQPQATATDSPAYSTQGRAKAHSRQGNPPRTKSNSGAAALPNAPPLPPTAPSIGRAAGTPQGSKVARGADTMKTPP